MLIQDFWGLVAQKKLVGSQNRGLLSALGSLHFQPLNLASIQIGREAKINQLWQTQPFVPAGVCVRGALAENDIEGVEVPVGNVAVVQVCQTREEAASELSHVGFVVGAVLEGLGKGAAHAELLN